MTGELNGVPVGVEGACDRTKLLPGPVLPVIPEGLPITVPGSFLVNIGTVLPDRTASCPEPVTAVLAVGDRTVGEGGTGGLPGAKLFLASLKAFEVVAAVLG